MRLNSDPKPYKSIGPTCAAALLLLSSTWASDIPYSPGLRAEHPDQVFWGDLHVHSRESLDAYAFGNISLSVEETLRFARGETVRASNGMLARLRRPLDFLLVADHSEYLGIFPGLRNNNPDALSTELGQRWSKYLATDDIESIMTEYVDMVQRLRPGEALSNAFQKSAWARHIAVSERLNDPGRFTALLGYEWTSMFKGGNLHRVTVFADGRSMVEQVLPYSALESLDPEDLWDALDAYERKTGGQALAIPHNANLSNGLLFARSTFGGSPINRAHAELRARWEPIYEVTQVKGDAEAHPKLSPDDEFADFETWSDDSIVRDPKEDWMLPFEYARSALKIGLDIQATAGANPFKFGLVGGTDTHTGLATADDNNFFGKFPDSEPSKSRLSSKMGGYLWENWKLAASGYTGIWARQNTREELFAALKRREVYATTGPRITLRLFGGWDYDDADALRPDYAEIGYAKGVPMGGDLSTAGQDQVPKFIVVASKDTDGANLDRIQIIKGWRSRSGSLHERVYDVALSDQRIIDIKTGKAPVVGSTVNVANATYTNQIGAAALSTVWTDPDFDPELSAFYYVRAIEIPTPRWTAYDQRYFGVKANPATPLVTQERAYSSPIWYTP